MNNLVNQAGTGGVTTGNNVALTTANAGTAVVITGNALIGTQPDKRPSGRYHWFMLRQLPQALR